jgi:hypothetical protein
MNMAARKKLDRTRWNVERERFWLVDQAPPPPEPELSLRPEIDLFFKNLDSKAGSAMQRISGRWNDIAGAAIAAHSCPGRLVNNILYVYVDSSTWLSEIKRYHSSSVRSKTQEILGPGTVKAIRYQVNPGECRAAFDGK